MTDDTVAETQSRFTGPIVTIKAGADVGVPSTFTVHENILKDDCEFFQAALDIKWREGQLREVDLPEDRPKTIGAYIRWLYERNICVTSTNELDKVPAINEQFDHLSHLYVFGEKIQSTRFRNAVISAILQVRDGGVGAGKMIYSPPCSAVKIVYDGTVAGSGARKLMVHLYAEVGASDWLVESTAFHNSDFLLDLAKALMDKRPQAFAKFFDQRSQWLVKE